MHYTDYEAHKLDEEFDAREDRKAEARETLAKWYREADQRALFDALNYVNRQDIYLLSLPGWSRHSDGIVRTGRDVESVESLRERIEQLESDLIDVQEERTAAERERDDVHGELDAAWEDLENERIHNQELQQLNEDIRDEAQVIACELAEIKAKYQEGK